MKKFNIQPSTMPSLARFYLAACTICITICPAPTAAAAEYLTGIEWEEPKQVIPGKNNQAPPSDAVVLSVMEHSNAQLEKEVFAQQGEIESLKRINGLLQEKFDRLLHSEDLQGEILNQKPPHY